MKLFPVFKKSSYSIYFGLQLALLALFITGCEQIVEPDSQIPGGHVNRCVNKIRRRPPQR